VVGNNYKSAVKNDRDNEQAVGSTIIGLLTPHTDAIGGIYQARENALFDRPVSRNFHFDQF